MKIPWHLLAAWLTRNFGSEITVAKKGSWYNINGDVDVKQYPSYFFPRVLRMDFSTAIRSQNVLEQDFTSVPRHWFIDAWFVCRRCKEEFCWTAEEQKNWFDEWKFYVDSVPHCCKPCRQAIRSQKQLRDQYAVGIAAALRKSAAPEAKREMIETIDRIIESSDGRISEKFREKRDILERQLRKTEPQS